MVQVVTGVGALPTGVGASVSIPLHYNTLPEASVTWYPALVHLDHPPPSSSPPPAATHPLAVWWLCGAQGKVVRMRSTGGNLDLVVATDTCHDCPGKERNQEGRHGMW